MSKTETCRGFTLIELLVVIAIIAVMAGILFPVFARAREKAYETTCLNNQRQIALSIQIWAQDNGGRYPAAQTVWQSLNLPPKLLLCPTAGAKQLNAYGYSYGLNNRSLGSKLLSSPETLMVTADAAPSANNILMYNGNIALRHGGKTVMSYGDGHVALTNAIPNFIILDNAQNLWDGFPTMPTPLGYCSDSAANRAGNFPPGWECYQYAIGSTFNPMSPGTPVSYSDMQSGTLLNGGDGMVSWWMDYLYLSNSSAAWGAAGWGYPDSGVNYAATKALFGQTTACQMWSINFGDPAAV